MMLRRPDVLSSWKAVGLKPSPGNTRARQPIFGFPVSGLDAGGLFTHRVVGPEAVTGAAFGPEAGMLAVVVQLLGIVVLVLWWRRRPRRADEPAAY